MKIGNHFVRILIHLVKNKNRVFLNTEDSSVLSKAELITEVGDKWCANYNGKYYLEDNHIRKAKIGQISCLIYITISQGSEWFEGFVSEKPSALSKGWFIVKWCQEDGVLTSEDSDI